MGGSISPEIPQSIGNEFGDRLDPLMGLPYVNPDGSFGINDESFRVELRTGKKTSRRDFLKAAGTGAVALAFSKFELLPPLETGLTDDIPLAVQLDVPYGYTVHIPTNSFERVGDLTRDTTLIAQILADNNYPSKSALTRFREKDLVFVPNSFPILPQGRDQLLGVLSAGLYPRVVNNPNVEGEEDFTSRERKMFGVLFQTSILPFLERVLPPPATRGVILIQRPDAEIIERYKRFEGTRSFEWASGIFHTGTYKDVSPQNFSYRRDMGSNARMVEAITSEGLVLSRIYLMRRPSRRLREMLNRSPFDPLNPEWLKFFVNAKKSGAHELAHAFVSDKIIMPPFDPHRIIAAVGIGAVLEGMTQRGHWQKGGLKDNLWNDPYLQLMRRDRGVFRRLFDILGVNKKPFPTVFSEEEVVEAFKTVVSGSDDLEDMGSATDILNNIGDSIVSAPDDQEEI